MNFIFHVYYTCIEAEGLLGWEPTTLGLAVLNIDMFNSN